MTITCNVSNARRRLSMTNVNWEETLEKLKHPYKDVERHVCEICETVDECIATLKEMELRKNIDWTIHSPTKATISFQGKRKLRFWSRK